MEIWRSVKGYEGFYEISNKGRLKSLKRSFIIPYSKGVVNKGEKILYHQVCIKGYASCKLSLKGKSRRIKIHRLVAIAFIPNTYNKPQVNHINGIKTDNRVENLEWVTNSENQLHALKNGLKSKLLKKEDVLKIRSDNRKLLQIAKDYNCSFQTISEIKLRKTWNHI